MKPLAYTKIPDYFFDTLMSNLSGAEFKILMYIARKTIGWNKERDRITHSQFEKTGLSLRSISSAIASLEAKKLIEITDNKGNTLYSQNRKHKTHIYYTCGQSNAKIAMTIAKTALEPMQKLHITIDTNIQEAKGIKSTRKKSDAQRINEILSSQR